MRFRRSWGRLPSTRSVSSGAQRREKQKRDEDNCEKKKKRKQTAPSSASGLYPHTPSPTRPIYPTHDFVPSLWSELPSHLPPGEPRPPVGNPHLTSVAIKRCALNLGRNHPCVFDAQHNQWSSFFLGGNSSG